jgi:hypothetical protein
MKRFAASLLASTAMFLACNACSPSPTAPSGADSTVVTPQNTAPLPPGSRVFGSPVPVSSSDTISGWTLESTYMLFPDGTFDLADGAGDYPGKYTERADGSITFDFDGVSLAGPWQASGALVGGQLTVHYNVIMALSDFEDAVYTLEPSAQSASRH